MNHPVRAVLFLFFQLVDGAGDLTGFSRSVSVSQEAFYKALSLNVTPVFAALLRFNNMAGVREASP